MDIIKNTSLSYEKIREDILKYILSHEEDSRWKSFMESNAGSIIIELIAGLGSYRAFFDLMAERESALETAITPSSILEHAADRGMLLSPTHAGIITISVRANGNLSVTKGDRIGYLSDYELYSLESFYIMDGYEKQFDCAVGHMNVFERDVIGFGNFDKFEFFLKDEFAALEFEELNVNDNIIDLQSDLNYLQSNKGSFVLRRVIPKEVIIYSGNGTLGYCDSTAKSFVYKVLSYGKDLEIKLKGATPSLHISARLNYSNLKATPDYEIETERVRGIARYYPLDGRIVTDQDYVSAISKYFGAGIHDVYAYNSDPNEEVYIILKNTLTEFDLTEICCMVDSKRGLGMKVNYHIKWEDEGKDMECNFAVAETEFNINIAPSIEEYLSKKRCRFIKGSKSISTWELATELSNNLGITIRPERDGTLGNYKNNVISLSNMDFIKNFIVSVKGVPFSEF